MGDSSPNLINYHFKWEWATSTELHLQRLFFQIKSYSQALGGGRSWTYLLGTLPFNPPQGV